MKKIYKPLSDRPYKKFVDMLGGITLQNEIGLKAKRNDDPKDLDLYLMSENRNVYYTVKRMMDFLLALILLILLSPLMLLVAILIFVYSPGPVLFKQERVGAKRKLHGSHYRWERANFQCYKFRTMKVNADTSVHQAYIKALIENDEAEMTAMQGVPTQPRKLVNDSRIIRPGKLLRKLSLDELPQFWNVLIGDMSLIGPRPAIPYEVEMYKNWHLRRLEAQPGITGLQQVTARCTAEFDQQVLLDIEYVEKQSLWLDLKIILKTPLAIISTKGAY
jgi:lipopolysaccharide/colanic/teichoic acid biosynthesis glycosyltransferase